MLESDNIFVECDVCQVSVSQNGIKCNLGSQIINISSKIMINVNNIVFPSIKLNINEDEFDESYLFISWAQLSQYTSTFKFDLDIEKVIKLSKFDVQCLNKKWPYSQEIFMTPLNGEIHHQQKQNKLKLKVKDKKKKEEEQMKEKNEIVKCKFNKCGDDIDIKDTIKHQTMHDIHHNQHKIHNENDNNNEMKNNSKERCYICGKDEPCEVSIILEGGGKHKYTSKCLGKYNFIKYPTVKSITYFSMKELWRNFIYACKYCKDNTSNKYVWYRNGMLHLKEKHPNLNLQEIDTRDLYPEKYEDDFLLLYNNIKLKKSKNKKKHEKIKLEKYAIT